MKHKRITSTWTLFTWTLFLFALTLPVVVLTGCNDAVNDWQGSPITSGDTDFVSGNPNAGEANDRTFALDADAGAADTASAQTNAADDSAVEREILEADIVQVEGSTLYTLSRYRGLSVIDISNPAQMTLLGRFEAYGEPFEMYVLDGQVLALYSSFYSYEYSAETLSFVENTSSRVIALDVTNPANIQEQGSFELPGAMSDTRIVGDVLYTVSYENGYCWGCEATPQTTVTSLNLANPAAIHVVDQLSYEETDYSWRRSISVNQNRMYVSGPSYSWTEEEAVSSIQVIDISDPAGDLVEGAMVPIAGQIESRWQMNERNGVLRVISQPGSTWGSGAQPRVETFEVVSSQELNPLGSMSMTLPRPENLMSVRFDGDRGYAVTFEQTDPLFVIDLSDPSQPVQTGELEIPGWLYHMEPRGDRLFAIGFDDTVDDGGLAVSLFDVADINSPVMIERVNFGGEWGWMPEDQDRIHKAFRILDEDGLILMPFSGWSQNEKGYNYTFHSGIQLIDFTRDTLTLRGVAPHSGTARRAFLNDGRLFAMSDDRVDAFDITDRDNPSLLSTVPLSRTVQQTIRAGNYMVELVANWWTGAASLEIYPSTSPDAQTPIGSVSLESLKPESALDYYYWGSGFDYYSARLFQHGTNIYIVWPEYNGYLANDGQYYEDNNLGTAVISIANPAEPIMVTKKMFPLETDNLYFYDDYGYYGYYGSGIVNTGDSHVQRGAVVAMEISSGASVAVFDFSNPADPQLQVLTDREGSDISGLADGHGVIYSSHSEPIEDDETRHRFYLDRLDVSNPALPQWLPKVNIPGTPVYYNHQTGQLITVDYIRTASPAVDWDRCMRGRSWSNAWYDEDTGQCEYVTYGLVFLTVDGNTAVARDWQPLEDVAQITRVIASDTTLFMQSPSYSEYNAVTDKYNEYPGYIMAWSLVNESPLARPGEWTMQSPGGNIEMAIGNRVLVAHRWPTIASVQQVTATGINTLADVQINGYITDIFMEPHQIVASCDSWGIQTFPF